MAKGSEGGQKIDILVTLSFRHIYFLDFYQMLTHFASTAHKQCDGHTK